MIVTVLALVSRISRTLAVTWTAGSASEDRVGLGGGGSKPGVLLIVGIGRCLLGKGSGLMTELLIPIKGANPILSAAAVTLVLLASTAIPAAGSASAIRQAQWLEYVTP